MCKVRSVGNPLWFNVWFRVKHLAFYFAPEQTTMSKDKEIRFLDEHSRDCGPTDRIKGEIKQPIEPIEIK